MVQVFIYLLEKITRSKRGTSRAVIPINGLILWLPAATFAASTIFTESCFISLVARRMCQFLPAACFVVRMTTGFLAFPVHFRCLLG